MFPGMTSQALLLSTKGQTTLVGASGCPLEEITTQLNNCYPNFLMAYNSPRAGKLHCTTCCPVLPIRNCTTLNGPIRGPLLLFLTAPLFGTHRQRWPNRLSSGYSSSGPNDLLPRQLSFYYLECCNADGSAHRDTCRTFAPTIPEIQQAKTTRPHPLRVTPSR